MANGFSSGDKNSVSEIVIFHIVLHFLVPALVAKVATPKNFLRNYLIMAATMLVDLDHLFAVPVYDPLRCSIGFHPLHTLLPVLAYLVLCCIPKVRFIGFGLVIHMLLDTADCAFMPSGVSQLLALFQL